METEDLYAHLLDGELVEQMVANNDYLLFYIFVVFMPITVLNQAGIDTTIITNIVTMVLISFLLAFTLGLGLDFRDIIADLLRSFYARKTYAVGDKLSSVMMPSLLGP